MAVSHFVKVDAAVDDVAVVRQIGEVIYSNQSTAVAAVCGVITEGFGAELNYYKTFRSAYDRTFETADYSAQTEVIGGAFDVNEALREAIEFQAKNGF